MAVVGVPPPYDTAATVIAVPLTAWTLPKTPMPAPGDRLGFGVRAAPLGRADGVHSGLPVGRPPPGPPAQDPLTGSPTEIEDATRGVPLWAVAERTVTQEPAFTSARVPATVSVIFVEAE